MTSSPSPSRPIDVAANREGLNEMNARDDGRSGNKPSLISPDRLGALLQARRVELGLELADMAEQSDGGFTTGFLSRAEQGLVLLTDPVAERLVKLYNLDAGSLSPDRNNKLIVDLPGRRLAVGSQSYEIGRTTDPLSGDKLVDAVLERYLSLLYLLRGIEPGHELAIRDDDLAVLGETLELELARVERRLAQLMLDETVDARTRSLVGRFLLPNAGLLVAATVVGSFIISSVSPGDVAGSQTSAGAIGGQETEQLIDAPDFPTTVSIAPTQTPRDSSTTTQDEAIQARSSTTTVETSPADPSPRATDTAETESGDPESVDDQLVDAESVDDITADSGEAAVTDPPQTDLSESEPGPTELAAIDPTTLGVEAEALITYDWRSVLPDWRITYMTDRPGYRGLTFPQTRSIEIYVDDDDTPGAIAEILSHELGHAIDVTHFGGTERTQWIEARDMPAVWWAGDGLNDFSVGAGDFAEAVARLWVGSPSNSTYGEFTPDQLELAKELLP